MLDQRKILDVTALRFPLLREYLPESMVRVGIEAGSWQEVVDHAGRLLLETRMIAPKYIEAIKNLIIRNEAYMVIVPGFALLHARPEDGAHGECLCLVTLNEPVPFGHPTNDPVDIAIAFAAHQSDKHVEILAEIAALIQDDVRWDIIRNANNARQVVDAISQE